MAESITIKALQDASLDAKSLEEVVNGNEVKQVTTRKGETYPSVKKAINTMFENGGLPATPFKTKALMTASALVDGKYAMVTDDTVNNGLYVKTAGAWVKSAYDPLTQAKSYTDTQIDIKTKIFSTLDLLKASNLSDGNLAIVIDDSDVNNNGDYRKTSGVWNKVNNHKGLPLNNLTQTYQYPDPVSKLWRFSTEYLIGSVVPITAASSYEVAAGKDSVAIYLMLKKETWDEAENGAARDLDMARLHILTPNTKKTIYVSSEVKAIYVIQKLNVSGGISYRTPKYMLPINDDRRVDVVTKTDLLKLDDRISAAANFLGESYNEPSTFKHYTGANLGNHGGVLPKKRTKAEYNNAGIKTLRVQLVAGDVLEFDYEQIRAPNLWEVISVSEDTAYPLLLTTNRNPNRIYRHRYVAHKNVILDIVGSIENSVLVNGVKAVYEDLGVYSTWMNAGTESNVPAQLFKMSAHIALKKGDSVKVENVGKGHIVILFLEAGKNNTFHCGVGVPADYANNDLVWVADSDVVIKVSSLIESSVLIKKPNTIDKTLQDLRIDIMQNLPTGGGDGSTTAPPLPPLEVNEFRNPMILPELEYVFATHQNFILKTETINFIDYILLSSDLGKTWTYIENEIGDIVSYHFFSDNTIMLCSPDAVWYSSNHTSFTRSIVYDIDGSIFVPTTHHFFCQQHGNRQMFVGDTEMFVWGEYVIANPNPRIWYTTDYGRTVKCAVKFDETVMDGITPIIRHVHDVAQDPFTEKFYLTTGDRTGTVYTENYFFSADYNEGSDEFTWKLIGQDHPFKLGKLFFDKTYAYFITDYTPDGGLSDKNGIYRVAKKFLHDITKYSAIWTVDPAEWGKVAPFRLVMDRNGNKVLLLDWIGQGVIFIATDGLNFRKARLDKRVLLSYVIGENYNGDIYCVTNNKSSDMTVNANLKLTGGTYNLTRLLQQNGVPNFMKGQILINNYNNSVGG